jgi:hypothetical protein
LLSSNEAHFLQEFNNHDSLAVLQQPIKPIKWEVNDENEYESIFSQCNAKSALREINGRAISSNYMSTLKKNGCSFDEIVTEIENRLNNPPAEAKLQIYQFTTEEEFMKDYNSLYGNRKKFNTPLGVTACMGDEQNKKLLGHDSNHARTRILYAIQPILENPTAIIWESPSQKEKKLHHSGTLIFVKSFYIENNVKAINSIYNREG